MAIDSSAALDAASAALEDLPEVAAQRATLRVDGAEERVKPDGVVPGELVRFLARLRLLEGVPFSYLVADADLLPLETIRFFYVDRNWLDALVQGALSVGTVNSSDREQLAALYPQVRREVDAAERLVRQRDADAVADDLQGRPVGEAGPITGFLLRSRLVSGWPGLHVRGYAQDTVADAATIPDDDPSRDRMRVLRMERLAPAVLLVLFDGVPAVVHIEEPRSGIQFGVRVSADAQAGTCTAEVTTRALKAGDPPPKTVYPRFRRGAPGVLDIKGLAKTLGTADAGAFAVQMLRFPVRQVFGAVPGEDSDNDSVDAFVPTVATPELRQRFTGARRVLGLGDGGDNG